MNPRFRSALVWIRSLHVYASLAAFLLLFFFTLTGWLMVHEDALGLNRVRSHEERLALPALPPEAWADHARSLGVRGTLQEQDESSLTFSRPGGSDYLEFDTDAGEVLWIRETRGLSGWLFDLHRFRGGSGGLTVIADLTAALFLLVSLSGLFLWLPLSRRRKLGLAALLSGGLLCLLLFFLSA